MSDHQVGSGTMDYAKELAEEVWRVVKSPYAVSLKVQSCALSGPASARITPAPIPFLLQDN